MEEVANATSAAANPAPAPAPVPAPTATPAPATTPPPTDSGSGGSFVDVLKKDAVYITFGILGATALFALIYYYRYNTQTAKGFQVSFQNQLDDMKIELSDLKSVENKKTSSADGGLFVNAGGYMEEQW
jgi:hypothetical protein